MRHDGTPRRVVSAITAMKESRVGLFDVFANRNADNATGPRQEPDGAMAQRASAFVEKLLSIGFDGSGRFDSAHEVAEAAQRRRSDPERVVEDLVAQHTRLAATSGFVTGLGGFAVMLVALPANVAGFYVIATRMALASKIADNQVVLIDKLAFEQPKTKEAATETKTPAEKPKSTTGTSTVTTNTNSNTSGSKNP